MKGKAKQCTLPIFLCLLVVVMIGTAQMTFAKTSGDWEYNIYKEYGETVARLNGYNGSATSINVPKIIDGYKVSSLENTFSGNKTITSVTIPNSVTELWQPFEKCSKLKKVKLTASIKSYTFAFIGSGIEEITLPKGKYDLYGAFKNCTSLKKVVIQGTVTNLFETFNGCKNLTVVSIAGAVKDTDAQAAFYKCERLQSITIPKGLDASYHTFGKCTNLKFLYLPKDISISAAFSYCFKLKDIYFAGSKSEWTVLMKMYEKEAGDKLSQAIIHYNAKSLPRTGLVKEDGKWIYVVNDKLSPKTGLVKRADGKGSWYYVEKGVYKEKTGLAKRIDGKGGWYYVEKGVYKEKSGLAKRIDGKGSWYYVEKGVHKTKTGITKRVDGKSGWYYVEKGVYKLESIGLAKRVDGKGGWFYVEDGKHKPMTGLTTRIDGKGGWFYVEKGVYKTNRTGLAKRINGIDGWYYVRNGKYDATKTGMVKRIDGIGGLFYVKNGILQDKPAGNNSGGSSVAPSGGGNYILNTNSMKFHRPGCRAAARISSKNRATSTDSRSTLISEGYSPCGICNP